MVEASVWTRTRLQSLLNHGINHSLSSSPSSSDHHHLTIANPQGVAGKDEEKVLLQGPVTAHGNIEDATEVATARPVQCWLFGVPATAARGPRGMASELGGWDATKRSSGVPRRRVMKAPTLMIVNDDKWWSLRWSMMIDDYWWFYWWLMVVNDGWLYYIEWWLWFTELITTVHDFLLCWLMVIIASAWVSHQVTIG